MFLERKELKKIACEKEGAKILSSGAICLDTGSHTGRSPDAKFIVRDETTESSIDWSYVPGVSEENWQQIKSKFEEFSKDKDYYEQRVFVGNPSFAGLNLKINTELAWHSIFSLNMFSESQTEIHDFELFYVPSFYKDPIVLISFKDKMILISGTEYAGEMKKSAFTVLNHVLPEMGILPMHASVNLDLEETNPTIFFGLSGTGKTSLSAGEDKKLIGDDEHGWSNFGIFNFENGCYAKVIDLDPDKEPIIWKACNNENTVFENVVLKDGEVDFSDSSKTQNTRASYPLNSVSNSVPSRGTDLQPKNIVFLTCDAFGILPAIARLTPEESRKFFTVGYTSKIAGTEKGITHPVATFSPCFGLPFMTRRVSEYAEMLEDLCRKNHVNCWMLNTGWTNGPYGVGERISIKDTRKLLEMIQNGEASSLEIFEHPYTGMHVPEVPGVNLSLIKPELGWEKIKDYETACKSLFEEMYLNLEKSKS